VHDGSWLLWMTGREHEHAREMRLFVRQKYSIFVCRNRI
jgi:hypothetical protein